MTPMLCLRAMRRVRVCLLAVGLGLLSVGATAPAAAVQNDDMSPAQLFEDFVHYTNVAKPDLAQAFARKLLESGLTNAEMATELEESGLDPERFENAMLRALLVPDLEEYAAEIGRRLEEGRLDLARDPQRITEAIGMLTGTQRQKMLGENRLEAAGEYAVPMLLKTITEGRDEKLKQACREVIRTIGRQAVTPLCEALAQLDPGTQRGVCDLLGDIGYPHAAPYLRELSDNPDTPGPVRDAAQRAFNTVGGAMVPLSGLYADLAGEYYRGTGSLVAFPYEATNNVWSYDAFVGLAGTPVPTSIYNEIMAMRLAAKAVDLDSANRQALAMYIAANLKRENDLPDGEVDPIFGDNDYSPDFYATVFGTQACQDVLGIALDTTDTPLVRDAIRALGQTTGGANLFADAGRLPLLEALSYPDRRVQYESALVLGEALPMQAFAGDFRVVPLLSSAVRTGNRAFAVVLADDDENRRQEVIRLEGLGYTILGAEYSLDALSLPIAESVGVDLAVVRMNDVEESRRLQSELHILPKTAATPVLILAPAVDIALIERDYRDSRLVKVSRPVGGQAFENVLDELLDRAAGGRMSDAEAEIYAIEALSALEQIAISDSPAFNIVDAEFALLDALDERTGGVRLMVADILALIGSDTAQRALFDAALAATGGERIDLLDRVADSVKRFGDRAEQRHVSVLVDLVGESTGATAEAAARVHGALNVRDSGAVDLIVP